MSKRIYNILFHTHTISGIIISAALYVIFFTGSIAFLRDEINAWERNQPIEEDYFNQIDFDTALNSLEQEKELYGRDLSFSHRYFEQMVNGNMTASKDTTIVDKDRGRLANYFFMDMETFEKSSYTENYSLGEFFYRLHFFAQLNLFGRSGYFLSGFVAFFFLFAVITGVAVHWNKIISSFYVFRPGAKWKTIWTDAHVSLGMIGLPYQFMFAVTGCYLMLGYMLMIPPVEKYAFKENPGELRQATQVEETQIFEYEGEKLESMPSINLMVEKTLQQWPDLKIHQLDIYNYGDRGMHVKVTGSPGYRDNLLGAAYQTFKASNGEVVAQKSIAESTSYAQGATNILRRLHYGDYGGYGMKLIYLCLGLITCFVILSGVYIWLVARDKKNVSNSKRKFNSWLVTIYTAICLSLYPMTAIIFSAIKLFGDNYSGESRKDFLYQVFFWGWLLLSVIFTAVRNNRFTTKACLLLGGVFGIFVPISNGIATGNWLWVSAENAYEQLLVVDLFWILTSLTSFAVLFKMKQKNAHLARR